MLSTEVERSSNVCYWVKFTSHQITIGQINAIHGNTKIVSYNTLSPIVLIVIKLESFVAEILSTGIFLIAAAAGAVVLKYIREQQ